MLFRSHTHWMFQWRARAPGGSRGSCTTRVSCPCGLSPHLACLVFGPFLDFLDRFGPFRVRVGPFSILKASNHTSSSRRIHPRYPGALGNSFDFLFVFRISFLTFLRVPAEGLGPRKKSRPRDLIPSSRLPPSNTHNTCARLNRYSRIPDAGDNKVLE